MLILVRANVLIRSVTFTQKFSLFFRIDCFQCLPQMLYFPIVLLPASGRFLRRAPNLLGIWPVLSLITRLRRPPLYFRPKLPSLQAPLCIFSVIFICPLNMTAVVWYVVRTVAGSSSWPGQAEPAKEQNKYKMAANSQPRASIQVRLPASQLHSSYSVKMIIHHYHYHSRHLLTF